MYNYLDKTSLFETFSESGQLLIFILLIDKKKNAERKLYQDVIQLLQKQHKESSSLCSDGFFPFFLEVLQKAFFKSQSNMCCVFSQAL